eukprot:TRINITY_DN5824_c0_g1_i1.p1 TRINITY_DN5824_c0_g1~~TRINITY_DN5824_c0_g1_i1.p1  ORF type:complete len:388 (+),score=109.48 TRINITY_DN5824_c0_g1_i1:272-1435(+)
MSNEEEVEALKRELAEQKALNSILSDKLAEYVAAEVKDEEKIEEKTEYPPDPRYVEGEAIAVECRALNDLTPEERHTQLNWERLEALLKRESKMGGNPMPYYCSPPSELLTKMGEYRDERYQILKSKKKEKSVESSFDPSAFSWNLDLLDKFVWKQIFLLVGPDNGNWLSNLLVNKKWNSYFVASGVMDPRKKIYGENALCYIIHHNCWDSFESVSKNNKSIKKNLLSYALKYNNLEALITGLKRADIDEEEKISWAGAFLANTAASDQLPEVFMEQRELLKKIMSKDSFRKAIEGCLTSIWDESVLQKMGGIHGLFFDELDDIDLLRRSMMNFSTSQTRFIIKHSNLRITNELLEQCTYRDRYERVRRGRPDPPPPKAPRLMLPRE